MQNSKSGKTAVTARFPTGDYLQMLEEAEAKNVSVADVIRDAWQQRNQADQMRQQLQKQEIRMRAVMFWMLCEVVGLTNDEQARARSNLEKRGVKW